MKFRRILASGGALGLSVLVTVAPGVARAQSANACNATDNYSQITLNVNSPQDAVTSKSPGVNFSGDYVHTGGGSLTSAPPTVKSLRIELSSCSADYDPPAGSGNLPVGDGRSAAYNWDASFVWNGKFQATITADDNAGQRTVRVRRFAIEVAPAKPAGVDANPGSGGVTVTWVVNTERDIRGYEVWRSPANNSASSAAVEVASTTASITKVVDTSANPGDYNYTVRAVRPDSDGNPTIRSVSSNPARATVAASATTTTAPAGGSSGGTSGSGTGSSGAGTGTGSSAGSGTAGDGSTSSGSGSTARASSGSVDLSNFAALLDARRQNTKTVEEDPGFGATLPFDPNNPAASAPDSNTELGARQQATARAIGQSTYVDDSDRRRSLSFVAGGLILFVFSMSLVFLRGEVKRAEELEALDPDPFPQPDLNATLDDLVEMPETDLAGVPIAGVAIGGTTRRRRGPSAVARSAMSTSPPEVPAGDVDVAARANGSSASASANGSLLAADRPLPSRRRQRIHAPAVAPSLDISHPAD